MLLNNDSNSTLNSLFGTQKTGFTPTKNLSGIKEKEDETTTNSLENTRFVLGDEKNLTSIDQVKKNIIEQVFNKLMGSNNQNEEQNASLFPSVQYSTNSFSHEEANPYKQESLSQTPYGFLYESSQEYYEKTTIDFNASATINTPNGAYNIEINFSYTQEIYEKHSTAIKFQQEELQKNPMQINLAGDDYSFKDLKHIDLVFDMKKAEELEEENEKNQILLKFLQSVLDNKAQESKDNALQNQFMSEVAVFERTDESYSLLAQTQNGAGMYFSHQKSESNFMQASYDQNGNFSYQSFSSSYEQTTLAINV